MRLIPVLACVLLGFANTVVAASPRSAAVPFELYQDHIFVAAYVNGRGPFRFGFDTGASGDGRADAQLTSALSLPPAGTRETSDGIATATAGTVSVKSLRFGPVEKRDLQLISRDYNGGRHDQHSIMGIIGRDFVAGWLITIDYPHRLILFRHGHLHRGDRGVVSYGPSFSIPVCFGSTCYPGKVDTGSSRTVVVPKDVAAKLSASTPVEVGEVRRTNSSATLYEMSLEEPLRISDVVVRNQKVFYADPSEAVINIGSEFLKDYVLTIDQDRKLLKIGRP